MLNLWKILKAWRKSKTSQNSPKRESIPDEKKYLRNFCPVKQRRIHAHNFISTQFCFWFKNKTTSSEVSGKISSVVQKGAAWLNKGAAWLSWRLPPNLFLSLWKNLKPNLTSVGHILHVVIGEEACPPGADVGGCAVEGDRGAEPSRDPQVGDGGRQGRSQAGHPVTHLHILTKFPKMTNILLAYFSCPQDFSWAKTTFFSVPPP